MNNIIVPTDFSKNADNALRYAINIANHFRCNIHLIHTYLAYGREDPFVNIETMVRTDLEKKLSKILQENKAKLFPGTVLHAEVFEGFPVDIVCEYSEKINADLIIMGTQGASGLKEVFLGSNTAKLINKTNIPVLAIPADFKYQVIKNIVLAVDSEVVSTEKVVQPLLKLSKAYKSRVNVLHVNNKKRNGIIDVGLEIYMSNSRHSFHQVNDRDINHGINDFVKTKKADLLCMIQRKRSRLEKIFFESVVTKEVFDSPVPLLVLRD